jgi:cation diffusion facilitator CzcD-associated flavoprotein CzcO
MPTSATQTRVVIIGAGFSGIGLGIKLKLAGLNDFVILEKSDSVGGVWRENRYPGAACDIPSHLYSFSFEPKTDWRSKFAGQADILDYLKRCTHKYGLARHIRFNDEVTEARWNAAANRWIVRTRKGHVLETQALVAATGQLSRPYRPQLPGLNNFAGAVFHSAEWPSAYNLAGKRVAVIGTGASAIQFVPAIAPLVRKLTVFQRSAAYILPKPDQTYSSWQKSLFARLPGLLRLSRLLTYVDREITGIPFATWRGSMNLKRYFFFRFLRRSIKDEDLRARLTPNYRMGCKRILLSNDYYPAICRPNVELVTRAVRKIRSNMIIDSDGIEHKIDCIIFGTGFAAADFLVPIKITGARGRDLHRSWRSGAQAYLGMTVASFPNFFMLYGPNTNLAHNSIVYMIEHQIRYVIACLKRLYRDEIRRIEVKKDVQMHYNVKLQRRLQKALWSTGCTNWYVTADGTNTANWPGYSLEFSLRTRAPTWDDYAVG